MRNLTKSEYGAVQKHLAELAISRTGSVKQMPDAQFQYIREEVDRIIHQFNPSGGNGCLEAAMHALKGFFTVHQICQEFYWQEVWIRGGRKSLDAYNGVQQANSAL